MNFSVTYSFQLYHGPGVGSAPSENEYQEHFLGVKAADAWGWPHHLHVPNVMEIWEPKPPGTLRAIPGLLWDTFTFLITLPRFNKSKVPEYEGILYFQEYYSKVFLCFNNISVKNVIIISPNQICNVQSTGALERLLLKFVILNNMFQTHTMWYCICMCFIHIVVFGSWHQAAWRMVPTFQSNILPPASAYI
jgi:hypothetical protein